MRSMILGMVGLVGCSSGDESGALASRLDVLEANLAASNEHIATLEADLTTNGDRVATLEQELSALSGTTQSGASVFVGGNDDTWAFAIGSDVDLNEVEVDDSAQASGTVIMGEGSMVATSYTSTLPAGLWEASLTANWGIGIQEEAITQDVSLACDGASEVFSRPARLVAGDADSQGINVAHEFTARLILRTSAQALVSCTLATRVLEVARTGDGVLYNSLNGPSLARFVKLAD